MFRTVQECRTSISVPTLLVYPVCGCPNLFYESENGELNKSEKCHLTAGPITTTLCCRNKIFFFWIFVLIFYLSMIFFANLDFRFRFTSFCNYFCNWSRFYSTLISGNFKIDKWEIKIRLNLNLEGHAWFRTVPLKPVTDQCWCWVWCSFLVLF